MRTWHHVGCVVLALLAPAPLLADDPDPLPGTRALDWDGDLASRMIDGIDQFLLRKTAESPAKRASFWNRDTSSRESYEKSIAPNRDHLKHILGVRDPRVGARASTPWPHNIRGVTGGFFLEAAHGMPVLWSSFGDVDGEGLILMPTGDLDDPNGKKFLADVIVLPDADQTPEQLAGLLPGIPPDRQVALRLALSGCRVFVPALVDRHIEPRNGRAKLTNREFLQRPAYELGRSLAGYEIQEVLSLVDWYDTIGRKDSKSGKIGIFGYGEGGLLALEASAIDPRIDATAVSGAFDSRMDVWQEPVDRNVFGLLREFGGAELASMVAPRPLLIEASAWPDVTIPPGLGGAPGRLKTPPLADVEREFQRVKDLTRGLDTEGSLRLLASGENGDGPFASEPFLSAFFQTLAPGSTLAPVDESHWPPFPDPIEEHVQDHQKRLLHQFDRHNQQLLVESPYVRDEFMKNLDASSPEKYAETIEPYRDIFRDEIIGRFDDELLPPDPRSREVFDDPNFTGYEVVLDVFPDVFAYGILLVPKDIKDGERRPVVVCQHGLEGRPSDLADPSVNNPAYNQFAVRLAERGFITFSPQNPYIFKDRFRTLQRKANPLGKTLFSVIVPQHQQITGWLKSLPNVDPERIAFYGLSYGGKSAMRIPPLVPDYCLSICSADFNEWVWKNASTRSPYSYVWTDEYEIFEWNLGPTFNYAEMAALIAPRPFMVERGHFDGVAPDEMVAHEFARVRFLYEAKLGLKDQAVIEWFVGPHTIHGVGTFAFLHKHLRWPEPEQP